MEPKIVPKVMKTAILLINLNAFCTNLKSKKTSMTYCTKIPLKINKEIK